MKKSCDHHETGQRLAGSQVRLHGAEGIRRAVWEPTFFPPTARREAAAAFAKSARANGYGVLCAAGMAAHLAGAFAANTTPRCPLWAS